MLLKKICFRQFLILPSLLAWFTLCNSAIAGELEYWRFNARLSRLEFITDDAVRPSVKLIGNPTRLVVDLPNTRLGLSQSQTIGSFVREVRVGQFNSQTARMVVELGADYTMRPREIKVRSLAPNRWFVQLPKLQPYSEQLPPSNGSVAISVPATSTPSSRLTVAIDPGHGGLDVGAIGRGGLQEKNVNLPIALAVASQLQQQGVQTVLTRPSDRDVSLESRVIQAEEANASIFVSIHANAISLSRPEVNGLETYYYQSGQRLAQSIHNSILRRLNIRDRGVRQAGFYVLRKTSMPAVLVEVGFVTGQEDSRNLSNSTYRQKMAEAIADGIVQYLR